MSTWSSDKRVKLAVPERPKMVVVFRLDALALSVIATATWLAGWLLHSGIVSKPLNLSENFFDHLKAPSF